MNQQRHGDQPHYRDRIENEGFPLKGVFGRASIAPLLVRMTFVEPNGKNLNCSMV
jgi:hypothetical protein